MSSTLRQRIITAALLATLFVGAVLALPEAGFALLLAAVTLLAAWEWAALSGWSRGGRIGHVVLTGLLLLGYWTGREVTVVVLPPLFAATLFWLAAPLWLHRYAAGSWRLTSRTAWSAIGLLLLPVAWLALLQLHRHHGALPVLFLLVMIWLADSGAYFAGRRWGRRKLAPSISPGKTLEGVVGALAVTLVLAVAFASSAPGGPLFVLLCLVTVSYSIVGDLFESMLKRQRGVKDSGRLLPGHGGVLDRVDSLIAAAPIFALGWQLPALW